MPYSLVTGNKALVNVPSDFTNFDKAIEKQSFYDGIAIRIDEDMIAIDLDNCIKNGEISDWTMEIIEHFPKAYIEYSRVERDFIFSVITTKNMRL